MTWRFKVFDIPYKQKVVSMVNLFNKKNGKRRLSVERVNFVLVIGRWIVILIRRFSNRTV